MFCCEVCAQATKAHRVHNNNVIIDFMLNILILLFPLEASVLFNLMAIVDEFIQYQTIVINF